MSDSGPSNPFDGGAPQGPGGGQVYAPANVGTDVGGGGTSPGVFLQALQEIVTALNNLSVQTGNPTGSASGDISGSYPGPILVVGTHFASPLGLGQGGTGNMTGSPSGAAGGDLQGSFPNPTVNPAVIPGAIGALGGDLSGTLPNPTVVSIGGKAVVLGGSLTTSGAFALTLTLTNTTNSTLPAGTHTLAGLDVAQTWSALQQFDDGDLALKGATSGTLVQHAAAVAGASVLTWPAGTTDFSATGGTSEVVKQVSVGAPLTVGTLAATDLSDYSTSSWTPSLDIAGSATGITYASRTGTVTRIGREVFGYFSLTLTSKGAGTGVATIAGLPVTANASAASAGAGGAVVDYANMAGLTGVPLLQVGSSSTVLSLLSAGAAATAALDDTNLTNTSSLSGFFRYFT